MPAPAGGTFRYSLANRPRYNRNEPILLPGFIVGA